MSDISQFVVDPPPFEPVLCCDRVAARWERVYGSKSKKRAPVKKRSRKKR